MDAVEPLAHMGRPEASHRTVRAHRGRQRHVEEARAVSACQPAYELVLARVLCPAQLVRRDVAVVAAPGGGGGDGSLERKWRLEACAAAHGRRSAKQHDARRVRMSPHRTPGDEGVKSVIEVACDEFDARAPGGLGARELGPLLGEHQAAWQVVPHPQQHHVRVARGSLHKWVQDRESIALPHRVVITHHLRPEQQVGAHETEACGAIARRGRQVGDHHAVLHVAAEATAEHQHEREEGLQHRRVADDHNLLATKHVACARSLKPSQ